MLSKKDKEYFKKMLTRQLDEVLVKNGIALRGLRKPTEKCADRFDWAAFVCDREMNLKMQERQAALIKEILEALERLEHGTYGVCEECRETISEKRLKAKPVTSLCIECKTRQEEKHRVRKWKTAL
jgi:DnaK suppressor protein